MPSQSKLATIVSDVFLLTGTFVVLVNQERRIP